MKRRANKIKRLRAALLKGENSGASEPFDFDGFVARKRNEPRRPLDRTVDTKGPKSRKPRRLLVGKWRIFESDLWDSDFLDLVEPAYIRFDANGAGEFMFGAVSDTMDCHYSQDGASFTWAGFDEMDEARGDGDAELGDDGVLTIELSFHLGDDAVLKARRW